MPPYKKTRSKTRTEGLVIRGSYSEQEDIQLKKLYKQHSDRPDKWKIIASELNRNYKSVRERYVNHLDQTIDKSELTVEEKREIDDLQTNPCYLKEYRNKWPEIAKKLSLNRKEGRRTELQIKNYWNSKDRAQKRKNQNKERSYERISSRMNIKNIIRDV
ncbi:hypothetical protein RclHR1_06820009 [Rhizophagus clarus]|uniref:Transcription factor MYB59-like n=1 Tax=Rhizophagus clarus TaxID=94130 RepID=A0A2Z6SA12_9GLOM|nr:hypothetical protein RclHR1_06820009 [Rhizophagus clarus]GES97771.1 transcription factor MYB59-like [Rhizophagus clarus]